MNYEDDALESWGGLHDDDDDDDEEMDGVENNVNSDADGEDSDGGEGDDSDDSEEVAAIKRLVESHQQSNAHVPIRWYDADEENDGDDEVEWEPVQLHQDMSDNEPFVPPSERDDAPLSGILHEQLSNVDPRQFFPEFKIDKVLRFSRLFGAGFRASSKAHIWWGAKTARKRTAAAATTTTTASTSADASNAPADEQQTANEAAASNGGTGDSLQLDFAPPPPPEQCAIDDELRLMRPVDAAALDDKEKAEGDDESDIPPWRYGPARIWYDQMGVSSTGHGFDYGFKLRPPGKAPFPRVWAGTKEDKMYPPSTFLPVNLIHWEDNVIYDGEDIREEVIKKLTSGKQPICGWIPTQHTRTYESFMAALKSGAFAQMFSEKSATNPPRQIMGGADTDFAKEPGPNHSIFPMDNYDLVNTRWEDDVIWDSQNMEKIPEPKVLTLDFWDDPKIFGMPEDKAVDSDFHPSDSASGGPAQGETPTKLFDRKEHQFTKKSKMILGQVQQRQKQEEEEQLESSMAQMTDKDPFNMSNDEFYQPKNTSRQITSFSGGLLIQHSIPAQNIDRTFFPTHINPFKLRHFHRLPLGKRHLRSVGGSRFNSIYSLTKFIQKQNELRERQRQAEGGGEIFFMREVVDLTARDGDLAIVEYSEEHPPLLQQPGMASKIRNYYKRKPGKEAEPQFDFGETAFTHTSPFLGSLAPGTSIQSLENNLFRAPIYQHPPNRNDFLIIKNKQGYFIRSCPTLFTIGQECPLYEVPSPNSKRATLFVRDFLLAFIYRLFWASEYQPRRLKMEDIKAAFPHYAESSVRKRLKQCSDFKRLGQGPDQNYWVLRSDFRLPSKEEVLAMVTPEMCCAQYSMLAAEQRLKDAGYGEKYFFTPENEDDSDDQVTMEDEIKCAPWHTTRAYISAMKGKCLLDQTGIADPTGCGQGFSYVRVSAKPQKEDVPQVPKRLVTGTNADLRKLPLKEAKEICRDYGVKEDEINSLSRWEIIDVIRTLSTQAAKVKSDFSGMARFARGNIRFNFADMQEKYKKFCQHIFDLQNQMLGNSEPLSTDEGSSGEDSDSEELATKVESMLSAAKGKKTLTSADREQVEYEAEEKERQDLQRMLKEGAPSTSAADKDKENKDTLDLLTEAPASTGARKLKIYRTFVASDGRETVNVEVVTRPQLIEAYIRIRSTRDDAFIKHFAQMDEQYKEERRKEKRRLQDQLRRIRRNEAKAKSQGFPIGRPPNKPKPVVEKKPPPPIKPSLLKMRCSACHGTGHMKTNKHCPLYGKDAKAKPIPIGQIHPVALTDEQLMEQMEAPSGELMTVEGTKLKLSKALFEHHEKVKRSALKLHIPKQLLGDQQPRAKEENISNEDDDGEDDEVMTEDDAASTSARGLGRPRLSAGGASAAAKLRRGSTIGGEEEYLLGPQKSVHRRRADPKVSMATQLNSIIAELKLLPGAEHLLYAVNSKKVPDYYDKVSHPMDLQQIKMKINENKYELRQQFLADIKRMLDNSRLYNGDTHPVTDAARLMFETASKRIVEKEQRLIRLEKAINPLLDDNDMVGFSFILQSIVQECKNLPKSVAFHNRVDARKVPFYYQRVQRPMDLGTIDQNIKEHRYTTIESFRKDMEQIRINSEIYNGPPEKSLYTTKAKEIVDVANALIDQQSEQLKELETNIQKMLDQAEVESLATGGDASIGPDDLGDSRSRMNSPTPDVPGGHASADEMGVLALSDEEEDGVLQQDLAMSGDEQDDDDLDLDPVPDPLGGQLDSSEDLIDMDVYDPSADLLESSTMQRAGQLNADLALSDSDDDEEAAKRPRLDDLDIDEL